MLGSSTKSLSAIKCRSVAPSYEGLLHSPRDSGRRWLESPSADLKSSALNYSIQKCFMSFPLTFHCQNNSHNHDLKLNLNSSRLEADVMLLNAERKGVLATDFAPGLFSLLIVCMYLSDSPPPPPACLCHHHRTASLPCPCSDTLHQASPHDRSPSHPCQAPTPHAGLAASMLGFPLHSACAQPVLGCHFSPLRQCRAFHCQAYSVCVTLMPGHPLPTEDALLSQDGL